MFFPDSVHFFLTMFFFFPDNVGKKFGKVGPHFLKAEHRISVPRENIVKWKKQHGRKTLGKKEKNIVQRNKKNVAPDGINFA